MDSIQQYQFNKFGGLGDRKGSSYFQGKVGTNFSKTEANDYLSSFKGTKSTFNFDGFEKINFDDDPTQP